MSDKDTKKTPGYDEPEFHDDPEVYFNRKLDAMKDTDLLEAALGQEGVNEMFEDLSSDEKKEVNQQVREIANSYEEMLEMTAKALRDPEQRKKIIAELFQRI
jgi:hypothetical protein